MIGRCFLGAVQFLTIANVGRETCTPGHAAVFFPLVGVLLGLLAGSLYRIVSPQLGDSLGAMLAVIFLIAATGCLHEDGLADVADALRAGRSREAMMQILKDSRIGVYGGLALVVSFALRWQALARMQVNAIAGLAVVGGLSRCALVVLAGKSPGVGSGLGVTFRKECTGRTSVLVMSQALVIAGVALPVLGLARTLVLLAACTLVVWASRAYFLRRLGGVNGDCLGAACQCVEITALLVLACRF